MLQVLFNGTVNLLDLLKDLKTKVGPLGFPQSLFSRFWPLRSWCGRPLTVIQIFTSQAP